MKASRDGAEKIMGSSRPAYTNHVQLVGRVLLFGAPRDAYAAASDSADAVQDDGSPKPMNSSANKAPAARKAAYIVNTAAGENFISSAMACGARCRAGF